MCKWTQRLHVAPFVQDYLDIVHNWVGSFFAKYHAGRWKFPSSAASGTGDSRNAFMFWTWHTLMRYRFRELGGNSVKLFFFYFPSHFLLAGRCFLFSYSWRRILAQGVNVSSPYGTLVRCHKGRRMQVWRMDGWMFFKIHSVHFPPLKIISPTKHPYRFIVFNHQFLSFQFFLTSQRSKPWGVKSHMSLL